MPAPPLTPLAAAVLHAAEPERALEIDCGEGDGALFLAREYPRARIRGVDPSEETIRRARSRVGLDPEGRVAFKVGRAGSLPFPDDHFDLIAQIDTPPALGEAVRVLRPGGFLVLVSTRRRRGVLDLRRRRLERALARYRIEIVHAEDAGEGSFRVGRLRGSDSPGSGI